MAQRNCEICNKEFYAKPNHIKRGWGRFCSIDCQAKWQRDNKIHKGKNSPRWNSLEKKCRSCDKTVYVSPSRWADGRGRYCSRECWVKDMPSVVSGRKMSKKSREKISGKNHYNWKGGRSLINRKRLKCAEWTETKKKVYKRDKRICQHCKKKCGWMDISCHHIIPWRETKDDSLKNLVTLCRSCHAKADGFSYSM